MSFLTKTLPKLGKAFDKALCQITPLNASDLRLKSQEGSKLPKLFGELFNEVLDPSGIALNEPNIECVKRLRQLLYLFYKYELPYSNEEEQKVVNRFKKTEDDIVAFSSKLEEIRRRADGIAATDRVRRVRNLTTRNGPVGNSVQISMPAEKIAINAAFSSDCTERIDIRDEQCELAILTRRARILLSRVFASFDPTDIYPRHGPGAVATKQQLSEKYLWRNVSHRITTKYPLDAYFYASLGHFADELRNIDSITDDDLPARVILVPKDSRGPRLISCEPVDFQWIQQGLGRAIVELVERNNLTMYNVFFTNQQPNQFGALLGSTHGGYSTLDLNEASDRVSVDLVHLLFPAHICEYLDACRSSSTVLPDGEVIKLNKFAPMGSCLCFPILALTVWAILTAGAPDAYTQERILVYGDDVIVPRDYTLNAINNLESFGLKINRDKSCTKGFFRESCGQDAFKGVSVTPVRLRTVWTSSRSPESYASWLAYARSFYHLKYYSTYDYIVGRMVQLYGSLPGPESGLPDNQILPEVPETMEPIRTRTNLRSRERGLDRIKESYVWVVKSPSVNQVVDGWSMLLRYFSEKANDLNRRLPIEPDDRPQSLLRGDVMSPLASFSVSSYTRRRTSMLVRRWR